MRMTATFALNQLITHGFGVYLFAALVALLQNSVGITHWHLALIGALSQLSYLAGAMLMGAFGDRLDSGRSMLVTGSVISVSLLSMAWLENPVLIVAVLTLMSACAAISWSSLAELTTRYGDPQYHSTNLSTAASGTAWGFSLNGLLLLMLVPQFGWRSGWIVTGLLALLTVVLTFFMLRALNRQHRKPNPLNEESETHSVVLGGEHFSTNLSGLSARQLLRTVFRERTAFLASVICLGFGFSSVIFSTWLNTYLAELELPATLGGYSWTAAGLTGMAAGFLMGKLADRKGHGSAMLIGFAAFTLSLLAFQYAPQKFVTLVGFGYGLMYFPMWGIVLGWVSRKYSARVTMQMNSVTIVCFGVGGALGNLIAGSIQQVQGSLVDVYRMITIIALLLTMIAAYIWLTERTLKKPAAEAV